MKTKNYLHNSSKTYLQYHFYSDMISSKLGHIQTVFFQIFSHCFEIHDSYFILCNADTHNLSGDSLFTDEINITGLQIYNKCIYKKIFTN